MADRCIELEVKSIEEGIAKGMESLGASRDQISYEVLSEQKGGMLHWGSTVYKLRVYVKDTASIVTESSSTDEANAASASVDRQLDQLATAADGVNGFCKIDFQADGVYLTIYPAGINGKPIALEEVISKINADKINEISLEIVKDAVAAADSKPVKIAEPQPEIAEDGQVIINISPDKMRANATVIPPIGRGKAVSEDDIRNALVIQRVNFGIKNDSIGELVQGKSTTAVVAEGLAPVNGIDAKIEYGVHFAKGLKPTELSDGHVDYREINTIENINAGAVIASKIPATPGVLGKNVYGEMVIQKPGKECLFNVGKNVQISDDGNSLIAASDGRIDIDAHGRVSILPVLEVDNIDFNIGNIDFNGNLIIKGDVCDGFTVKASGDIVVRGSVGAATIEAGKGVAVTRGIVGKEHCTIKANGDVKAQFIESANIWSNGSVEAGEAIMHSTVNAEKRVSAGGRKGLIVGGLIRSGEEVIAKIIGSEMATKTEIEVGVVPQLKEEFIRLDGEVTLTEENLNKTRQAVTILTQLKGKCGQLPPDKEEMLQKLYLTQEHLQTQFQAMQERLTQITARMAEVRQGRVIASELIYTNVKITIRNSVFRTINPLKTVVLQEDAGEVRTGPYIPNRK